MDFPKNWVRIELGQICETTSGGTPSRKYPGYYSGSIPWIKSGELQYNTIQAAEEFISEDGLRNSSAKVFPPGTLLIALYGAAVGEPSSFILGFSGLVMLVAYVARRKFSEPNQD